MASLNSFDHYFDEDGTLSLEGWMCACGELADMGDIAPLGDHVFYDAFYSLFGLDEERNITRNELEVRWPYFIQADDENNLEEFLIQVASGEVKFASELEETEMDSYHDLPLQKADAMMCADLRATPTKRKRPDEATDTRGSDDTSGESRWPATLRSNASTQSSSADTRAATRTLAGRQEGVISARELGAECGAATEHQRVCNSRTSTAGRTMVAHAGLCESSEETIALSKPTAQMTQETAAWDPTVRSGPADQSVAGNARATAPIRSVTIGRAAEAIPRESATATNVQITCDQLGDSTESGAAARFYPPHEGFRDSHESATASNGRGAPASPINASQTAAGSNAALADTQSSDPRRTATTFFLSSAPTRVSGSATGVGNSCRATASQSVSSRTHASEARHSVPLAGSVHSSRGSGSTAGDRVQRNSVSLQRNSAAARQKESRHVKRWSLLSSPSLKVTPRKERSTISTRPDAQLTIELDALHEEIVRELRARNNAYRILEKYPAAKSRDLTLHMDAEVRVALIKYGQEDIATAPQKHEALNLSPTDAVIFMGAQDRLTKLCEKLRINGSRHGDVSDMVAGLARVTKELDRWEHATMMRQHSNPARQNKTDVIGISAFLQTLTHPTSKDL